MRLSPPLLLLLLTVSGDSRKVFLEKKKKEEKKEEKKKQTPDVDTQGSQTKRFAGCCDVCVSNDLSRRARAGPSESRTSKKKEKETAAAFKSVKH